MENTGPAHRKCLANDHAAADVVAVAGMCDSGIKLKDRQAQGTARAPP